MPTKAKLDDIVKQTVKGLPKQRAKQLAAFVRDYFSGIPANELVGRDTRYLVCLVKSHFELAQSWNRGYRSIRVFNPELQADGCD